MAKNLITIENTRFIFPTNFSGDPERDTFGSSDRKATIVIPTQEQADDLAELGFNVKCTTPKLGEEEGFKPTFYVAIKANYDSEWPPKIYLVTEGNDPVLLNKDTIATIDKSYITNVNVVLNPYYSERNRTWSLYIRTMYVEIDEAEDPFAARYRRAKMHKEELPFD